MLIRWALQLILFLIVVRLFWRFLTGVIDGLTPEAPRAGSNKGKAVKLERDPVCGTYVVRARALTSGTGTDTMYFCSEKCRDQYARQGPGRTRLKKAR